MGCAQTMQDATAVFVSSQASSSPTVTVEINTSISVSARPDMRNQNTVMPTTTTSVEGSSGISSEHTNCDGNDYRATTQTTADDNNRAPLTTSNSSTGSTGRVALTPILSPPRSPCGLSFVVTSPGVNVPFTAPTRHCNPITSLSWNDLHGLLPRSTLVVESMTLDVYQASYALSGKAVDVHQFALPTSLTTEVQRRLGLPAHPNINPLIGLCECNGNLYFVSPKSVGIPLSRLLLDPDRSLWQSTTVTRVFDETISALWFLHQYGIIHGHISLESLHWTRDERVLLQHYFCYTLARPPFSKSRGRAAVDYDRGPRIVGYPGDLYALVVCLGQVLAGSPSQFETIVHKTHTGNVAEAVRSLGQRHQLAPSLIILLEALVNQDASKRPVIDEVVSRRAEGQTNEL
jgi:hypothetical protein